MEGDHSNNFSNQLLHSLHQEIGPTGGLNEEDGWEWPARDVLEAGSDHEGQCDSQEAQLQVSANRMVTEEPCGTDSTFSS